MSADGLTQFQGTQWSQRLTFQKANCNSELCGNCQVSSSPIWWVCLQRGGPAARGGGGIGGHVIESELFDIRLKCIEMKIGRDSHGCQSNPFRGTQLVVTRLSG